MLHFLLAKEALLRSDVASIVSQSMPNPILIPAKRCIDKASVADKVATNSCMRWLCLHDDMANPSDCHSRWNGWEVHLSSEVSLLGDEIRI